MRFGLAGCPPKYRSVLGVPRRSTFADLPLLPGATEDLAPLDLTLEVVAAEHASPERLVELTFEVTAAELASLEPDASSDLFSISAASFPFLASKELIREDMCSKV